MSLVIAALVAAGCSAKHYRKSADKEASKLIREKSALVSNMDTNFTIEPQPLLILTNLPPAAEPPEFLGKEGEFERGARVLPLVTALETAVHGSREYQNRKELLFLSALNLSLTRQQFRPIPTGTASSQVQGSTPLQKFGVDPVTKLPVVVGQTDTKLVQGRTAFGASWLLNTGARLSLAFSADFLRYLAGTKRQVGSELSGDIVLPLLRGGGIAVTMEALTQAERDLLYDVRSFAQYRKEFAVITASSYFSVLQNRDQARNAYLDLQRSRQNAARETAFADEGLRPQASRDQLKQAELTSETRWIDAVRSYRESLDRFKIDLGLRLETPVVLDDRELNSLAISEPQVKPSEALEVAQAVRLDLQNQKDAADDAKRKIAVAKNGLLPRVDLRAGGALTGNTAADGFPLPDYRTWQWDAGLDVNLPLNRKAERNNYRAALIAVERSRRAHELAVDTVKLQIATDWRALEQAKRVHENALLSVTLAERRVEEQDLRMQLGRGVPRDLLDAQADLISARNLRTTALINHTLARLRYYRDMGLLVISETGQWSEATLSTETNAPPSQ